MSRIQVLKVAALPLLMLMLNSTKTSLLIGHSYGTALRWGNLVQKIYPNVPAAEKMRIGSLGR